MGLTTVLTHKILHKNIKLHKVNFFFLLVPKITIFTICLKKHVDFLDTLENFKTSYFISHLFKFKCTLSQLQHYKLTRFTKL